MVLHQFRNFMQLLEKFKVPLAKEHSSESFTRHRVSSHTRCKIASFVRIIMRPGHVTRKCHLINEVLPQHVEFHCRTVPTSDPFTQTCLAQIPHLIQPVI